MVCNGTQNIISQKELHCVMGCNYAINQFFQKLKDKIGVPPAPYLVADTLTATSLSLAWEGVRYSEISYLVQWRYEEHAGAWQYCRNQSWGPSRVVLVENLQPYTKYRFRVALLLSPHREPIVSEPSVVISTLPAGVPSSPPIIIRVTAVDSKRISISWKPGPFPNGPIHSYILELVGEYTALKEDIQATKTTDFYMFQNLNANSKYVVSISMRNAVGEGPAATAEVVTPPEASVKDALQPILILGSDHRVIKQGADMMLDVPGVIYKTSKFITGMAIHVNKNLLFVSDSDGYVSVATLREYTEPKYLLTPFDLTFKPHDLSVDWLNQHLYILGEVNHNKASLWQVARSSLSGTGLTVAVAGITVKPLHVEVDPYNGYLFWLIQGNNRGGLYRLDLANISNGIKHEVIPDLILEDPHLGAFIIDHVNFCILVPNHAKNTVYSVSLDGREVADLRSNTQQPLFQNVISLAFANGLFYWTNGEEVLTEDYHEEYHTYFHNHYLGSKNRSYVGVYIDLPSSQPIPVPVNPPIQVQAILGGRVAKISWQPPHIVGGQGKGAWQSWSYELQIKNEQTGEIITKRNINNSTYFTVDDLDEDTEYIIKSAAYTSSGNGPWSSEFKGRTLKTPKSGRYPSILWSASEGLLESDVTGDEVETLIAHEKLKSNSGDYHFVDISWYRDMLYLVTNTTKVHWYNMTSHDYGQLHHLDSVGSIAVDWIGRKLYWSNPKQQLIIRGDLYGFSPEPLLILTIAKELNIDSENAFIYWSTGHTVECARLNGDGRRVYYPAELFSGKQVMGLTLNLDDKHVYWIVRSNEGSNLYKAPMAYSNGPDEFELQPIKISSLKHANMQGPLRYFSDHLLWLQDNRKAVIGDLSGQNVAVISGMSLFGLNMVAVLDHNLPALRDDELRVIPESIDSSSIRIFGTSSAFNITWDPVVNVNYGQVFYDVKTEDGTKENIVKVSENQLVFERAKELPPYSELRVTIQAFTYWGSGPQVVRKIHSPPSLPGVPENLRAFVTYRRSMETDKKQIVVLLRWNPPKRPNGIIAAYKVQYFYLGREGDRFFDIYMEPHKLEVAIENLLENVTYFFQVKAFTSAGEGKYTKPVEADTGVEAPVPMLLVTTRDSVKIIDCDSQNHLTLSSGDHPVDITLNINEGWIYWLNDMQEIFGMRLDGTKKSKIHILNGTGLSLTIDWVGRFLYWSELEEKESGNSISTIHRLDISQVESGIFQVDKLVRREGEILEIEIMPFTNTLYWIEVTQDGAGHLMQGRTDGSGVTPLFPIRSSTSDRECTCSDHPTVGKTLTVDQTDPSKIAIIYSDDWQDQVFQTESEGCDCRLLVHSSKLPPTSITTDHKYLYWSNETEDSIFIFKENTEIQKFAFEGARKIVAIGSHLQPFPPAVCLTVSQETPIPALVDNSATSITLQLPKPERKRGCENVSVPSVQYVVYFGLIGENGMSDCNDDINKCKSIVTFKRTMKIKDLEPFSNYIFMVSLRNYFTSLKEPVVVGPPMVFATLAGAPSTPENVTATVLTPNTVEVRWISGNASADKTIWYQVHWRTEGVVAGVRQSGEQIVENPERAGDFLTGVIIRKLIPGQTYLIWVRAYSRHSSTYSESKMVEVKTFHQPYNITLVQASPYSLEVAWLPPNNQTHKYHVEFRHVSRYGEWKKVLNADDNNYSVDNLLPKTAYGFRAVIIYTESKEAYVWPQDGGFIFETLGDRPSRPGTPVIQQLRKDVFQVLWEKSRDNGAAIDYYALEGLVKNTWRRKREANYTSTEEGNKIVSEQWILYYNGSDNYWIINELSPSMKYVFRVKARNKFGWSDFSETSKSFDFTEAAMLADQEELSLVLGTTVPALLLCFVLVIGIFCCGNYHNRNSRAEILETILQSFIPVLTVSKKRDKEKKDLQILTMNTGSRGLGQTDVELATLRELPRRGNFIHNANVLYTPSIGPPLGDEIALLPHIRRDQFKLTKFLGSGAFGEVYEGVAQGLQVSMTGTRVAIKALRKGATEQEKAEFLKEAQLMSHFKHEHILQLVGVCLDNDPNYILMELMEGGDLLSYLRTNRPLMNTVNSIKLQDLLEICVDVTKGCRYLEEMHFVHRDLACRNCLVSSTDPTTRIVKIGDFGLARDIYKNDYYRKEGEGLLPVRWMAPESLVDGVFTSQSDVWAFGVLLWEIMTLGQQPYPARTNLEVLHYVRTGGRLERPNNCPEQVHQLMMKCWSFKPESRPTFKHCLETLTELREQTDNFTLITDFGGNYVEARVGDTDTGVENDGFYREDSENEVKRRESGDTNSLLKEPHKYLELICEKQVPECDGYEIPRFVSCNLKNRVRTFSTSSTASDGSQSTTNNVQSYDIVKSGVSLAEDNELSTTANSSG
ncbi:hypothetical protein RUM43_010321 [Polyplax serrata]|uniref:Tyrosine-protein kinase receptor n=1 Tax=Polyplax serrata TaxID=468196 RepID=A0AAN8P790_POLSC